MASYEVRASEIRLSFSACSARFGWLLGWLFSNGGYLKLKGHARERQIGTVCVVDIGDGRTLVWRRRLNYRQTERMEWSGMAASVIKWLIKLTLAIFESIAG